MRLFHIGVAATQWSGVQYGRIAKVIAGEASCSPSYGCLPGNCRTLLSSRTVSRYC